MEGTASKIAIELAFVAALSQEWRLASAPRSVRLAQGASGASAGTGASAIAQLLAAWGWRRANAAPRSIM